jgi:hypothetical protein
MSAAHQQVAAAVSVKIIRVFPRRTAATPDDDLVRINCGPGLFDEADEVHISVTFTWDIPTAERLAYQWERVAPVKIGGPAMGQAGGEFVPGMYLKTGYVMTSRGCPNRCAFCSVWKREDGMKELTIKPGNIVQDDNLLACTDGHIRRVFEMLKGQKNIELRGIEAKILKPWHVDEIAKIRLSQLFCAYDTPDDYEPLVNAGKMLQGINVTYTNRKARCYVLCGYEGDTFDAADKRMVQTVDAGFMPFAMLWRENNGDRDQQWMKWQRQWARPAIIASRLKQKAKL